MAVQDSPFFSSFTVNQWSIAGYKCCREIHTDWLQTLWFWKEIRRLWRTYLMTFRNEVFELKKKMVYFFHSQMAVLLFSRKSVIYWNSCVIIEFSLSSSYISNWLQTVFDVPTSWTCQGQTFPSVLMDGFTVWTALLPSPGYCPHV